MLVWVVAIVTVVAVRVRLAALLVRMSDSVKVLVHVFVMPEPDALLLGRRRSHLASA